jgi:hypothetical protein
MSNLGKLFTKTGPHSIKKLKKKKKKKGPDFKTPEKPKNPTPKDPKPKDPPKQTEKDKPDKPKKLTPGEKWQHVGKALKETGKQLSETESSERSKTQALKDKLYIRRRGKSGQT